MGLFSRKKIQSVDTMVNGANLVTLTKPQSLVAEQFRTIKTNITFMGVDHPIKALAFTSSNISEGKSTVTANVGVTWAQDNKRVLMVDADLRRPTMHSTFDLDNRQGLTTLLMDQEHVINSQDVIQATEVPNLDVLTVGPVPPNATGLLNSQRMRDLVATFEQMYDVVIIDVPSILEVNDTQVLSSMLDGVVLVVRSGVTQKVAVKRAVEMLNISKANLLGYVMNDVASGDDDGYGYGYGSVEPED